MNLERDIEPYLAKEVCNVYWDSPSDHKDFREIIDTLELTLHSSVVYVLVRLFMKGYIIRKIRK